LLAGTAAAIAAQVKAGADLTVSSRYQWRGLTRHDGTVFQIQAYLRGPLGPGVMGAAGVWSVIQPGRTDLPFGPGLGRTWFGEVSPWVEGTATVGGAEMTAGFTTYDFADGAEPAGAARSTSELYARLTTLELPVVVPRATLWYDVGAIDGAYLETGLALRVPLWPAALIPVGSLVLDGNLGWNLSQTDRPGDPGHFAKSGLTHADLSAGIATGVVGLLGLDAWLRGEVHHQLNGDARTRQAGGSSPRDDVTWVALTVSVLGPRCRPHREVCR
jgi:hypothetical protein